MNCVALVLRMEELLRWLIRLKVVRNVDFLQPHKNPQEAFTGGRLEKKELL